VVICLERCTDLNNNGPADAVATHCLLLLLLLHTFNGPFSGTTQVSRYQKGKTNLDFTGARDSECQWHQLGHMQVCTLLQTASTHIRQPPPLCFYRPDALPAARPTASKHTLSLASVKSRLVLPFLYRLTRVVPDKGPLNVCVCVCSLKIPINYVADLFQVGDVYQKYKKLSYRRGTARCLVTV